MHYNVHTSHRKSQSGAARERVTNCYISNLTHSIMNCFRMESFHVIIYNILTTKLTTPIKRKYTKS